VRFKASSQFGHDWNLHCDDSTGTSWNSQQITLILLHEIRNELKTLNRLLGCSRFVAIPTTLTTIARNTKKKAPRGR
jgi:hypothetical protein